MVKVTRVDEGGAEVATVEVDDFIIEIIYSGIAEMLREAEAGAAAGRSGSPAGGDLSREARQRRAKILNRVRN
jgi:hypothetical protein